MENQPKKTHPILLFDFDGTIADSIPVLFKLFNSHAKEYGFTPVKEEEIIIYKNKTIREIIPLLRISPLKIPFFIKQVLTEVQQNIAKLPQITGIGEVLRNLKTQGYTMFVLTSNNEENVRSFLQKEHLDMFDSIYGGSKIFGKDTSIKKFMKKRGLEKDQVIYIGDEVRDVEAAKRVGIRIVSVAWGFNSKEFLQTYNPDQLISSPEELPAAIQTIVRSA